MNSEGKILAKNGLLSKKYGKMGKKNHVTDRDLLTVEHLFFLHYSPFTIHYSLFIQHFLLLIMPYSSL